MNMSIETLEKVTRLEKLSNGNFVIYIHDNLWRNGQQFNSMETAEETLARSQGVWGKLNESI